MIGMRKLKFSTVSRPCYSYGLLSAIEAIHGVGPLPIFFNIPEFSKMCITLMQLIYMCGTVTCFYSVFEYYCTTEGHDVSENLTKFIMCDLYLYHRAVMLL
jgi:hypothetical protein